MNLQTCRMLVYVRPITNNLSSKSVKFLFLFSIHVHAKRYKGSTLSSMIQLMGKHKRRWEQSKIVLKPYNHDKCTCRNTGAKTQN